MPVEAQRREQERSDKHPSGAYRHLSMICSDLHMSLNGSSDPMTEEEEKYDYETLLCAVNGWIPDDSAYNAAQYALIMATIREYEIARKEPE